jgi:AcrR family transcriptional regulator
VSRPWASCIGNDVAYSEGVPRLWNETVETHRRAVSDAILDTTATLVAKHGLRSVTMSQIAEETGIGRATLYKYFPDVDAILLAWHERQVGDHLALLEKLRDGTDSPGERLEAVLEAFALIHYDFAAHQRHGGSATNGSDIAALLHRGEHVALAHKRLSDFMRDLLTEGARAGAVRTDIAPGELADYSLHTLTAAGALPSKAAVRRLVALTLSGLRPQR